VYVFPAIKKTIERYGKRAKLDTADFAYLAEKSIVTNNQINDQSKYWKKQCANENNQSEFSAASLAYGIPVSPNAGNYIEQEKCESKESENNKSEYDIAHVFQPRSTLLLPY
jgi:hypothetical protein